MCRSLELRGLVPWQRINLSISWFELDGQGRWSREGFTIQTHEDVIPNRCVPPKILYFTKQRDISRRLMEFHYSWFARFLSNELE